MKWFKVNKKKIINKVDAVDVRQDVFAELLKYIYTGTVSIEKISIWLLYYFCQIQYLSSQTRMWRISYQQPDIE